jgi:hypothetical protein
MAAGGRERENAGVEGRWHRRRGYEAIFDFILFMFGCGADAGFR